MASESKIYVMDIVEKTTSEDAILNGKCFVCGKNPSSGKGEHVFPLWLQNMFALHDMKLNLLNGTRIPYRQITVPCCKSCNTGFLSNIEQQVKGRLLENPTKLRREDYLLFGRWLVKILLGILVKETSLPVDRSNPALGMIMNPKFADNLKTAHLLLQSARKPTEFSCLHSDYPLSLYYYKINSSGGSGFDFSTNLVGGSISMVLGNLGLVFINDGGMQMEIGPKGPFKLVGKELSIRQFKEISARIHCKASLIDATHAYVNSETPKLLRVHQNHVSYFTKYGQVFEDWDEERLSYFMEMYTQQTRDTYFDDSTQTCKTILVDEYMNLIDHK